MIQYTEDMLYWAAPSALLNILHTNLPRAGLKHLLAFLCQLALIYFLLIGALARY